MIMEEDPQIADNIENLQAYCELLKQQGYNDDEINLIVQQELNNQQEAFLNENNQQNQDEYGSPDQEYEQEEDYINCHRNRGQDDDEFCGYENQEDQGNAYQNPNPQVRQYDQENYLIKPHIEEDQEEIHNEENPPLFSSFAQQYQFSHKNQQNVCQQKPSQSIVNSQESFGGILSEKNMQNQLNRRISNGVDQQQSQRNSTMSKQNNKETISRGSIYNSQKDDSIQQFAPLRSSERQNSDNSNLQNTYQVANTKITQNLRTPSVIKSQQQPSQKYFKTNQINQKNDENNFDNSTANFIRSSYQARTNDSQKIQTKSRSKTPTKIQKQVKILSQEEKQLLELKNKLRTVFTFYVSFGDRINVNYLKSNKFHKMMSDAQLKDNIVLTQNRLDLMFVKENHNKHNMDFDTFLTLVAKIAILKFPQYSDAQALQMILQNHFLPLYDNIMAETDLGEDELKFKEPIDEGPLTILKEVNPVLTQIYQHYFAFEWRNRGNEMQVKQKSESGVFQFLKEYDICPNLITKSSAFLLFREILDTECPDLCRNPQINDLSFFLQENQGYYFTYWRFAIYLIRIGNICYSNLFNQLEQPPEGANRSTAEKLAFLLERMELSAGFLNLDKKNQSHQSLIIKKKMINRVKNLIQNLAR